jgi:polyisoprenoid-binding protein YceI
MQAPSGQVSTPALQALLRGQILSGDWVLDPRSSSIRLKSKVMGVIPVSGVFREISGAGAVRPDGEISGTLTVAAASVDTGNTRRDTHLRSADFFDSGNYPDITFAADDIRPAGAGAAVTGALTVRGQTQPLSVHAAVSVQGDCEVLLDASVQINRADFGLTWNVMGLAAVISTLTIHAAFIRR